jgi:hypothetical protein
LGTHSRVLACDGESPFVAEAAFLIWPFTFAEHHDYLESALKIPLGHLGERVKDLCFESAMGRHLGARRVLREIVHGRKWPRRLNYWCSKTFPDQRQAEALKLVYPSSRFLYIVRTGWEVVNSRMRFRSMRHRSFEEHCEAWAEGVVRYDYVKDRPDALTIRHEDLVNDPHSVFAVVWRLLELPAEEAPARFVRTTLVHPLDEATKQDVNVQHEFGARRAAHMNWTESQRETFKRLCGEAMETLGYELPF